MSPQGASWLNERSEPSEFHAGHVLFSVIVPVLNEEKILGGTLSIYSPELRREFGFELIVSDGGSSDNSVAIARHFADKVVVHSGSQRQTIAEGRNLGAGSASGELFVFINADTIPATPKAFLRTIKELALGVKNHNKHVALACPVEVSPEEREFSDKVFSLIHNNYLRLMVNAMGKGMGRGECQIIDRRLFKQVAGYSHLAAGEDFDMMSKIVQTGQRVRIPNDLLVYESPRRFRKYGYLKLIHRWNMNWIWVNLFRRSYSKYWEEVR